MVKDEITLKEAVEGASYMLSAMVPILNPSRKDTMKQAIHTQHKPQNGEAVRTMQTLPCQTDQYQSSSQKNRSADTGDCEKSEDRRFIGRIPGNMGIYGVVGMRRNCGRHDRGILPGQLGDRRNEQDSID